MQSTPTLKDTDPHDVFAIETLLHAHAEKMPHAEKAPPLAHDPAAPPVAPQVQAAPKPQVHVAPPISVGGPLSQTEPTFSTPVARDIRPHGEIPADNVRPGEIKVDGLKALEERSTAKWARRTFMALLGLVGAVAAAAWQHYGDDATAMAAEWTPSFVLAALPSTAKPAVAEHPTAPVTETAAADQAAQPTPATAAAPAPAEPAATAAAAPVPSAESTQLQSMAQDLAAMGQQVEELKTTIAQLKASQAQMARELAKASEARASETRASEARAAVVAPPPPVARPAAPPPVRKPKPVSSYTPSYSPAPIAAAPVAPPPPVQAAAPPPAPPRQTIADDGEPVVRPPMPLR